MKRRLIDFSGTATVYAGREIDPRCLAPAAAMPHVLNLLEGVGCVGVVLADQFAAIQQTLYSTLYENLHHGCHAFAKFFFAFA